VRVHVRVCLCVARECLRKRGREPISPSHHPPQTRDESQAQHPPAQPFPCSLLSNPPTVPTQCCDGADDLDNKMTDSALEACYRITHGW
jgi:hypothetical protein